MSRLPTLSRFGRRFARATGAGQLMQDIGEAARNPAALLLGGGNPARIGAAEELFRAELARIAADADAFGRFAGRYAAPEGEQGFRETLAEMLTAELGAPITARNIALTAGSQNAFFLLFNLLAGPMEDGSIRRVVLPIVPEYIGYSDLGLDARTFRACRPRIELLEGRLFKYRLDEAALTLGPADAALCVSRPTNPTGNVLTDAEMSQLERVARAARVPLIVDAAYGLPFPGIVFGASHQRWNENTILCLSLSKLGLPAIRTGIVVASEAIVDALGAMSAVFGLAPPSTGAVMVEPMLRSGALLRLAREVIQPFYAAKAAQAVDWCHEALAGCNYRIHSPEGAFFLWLWLPSLSITTTELYQRLKARNVIVVPGEYFFPGMAEDEWEHSHECLRVSYAQEAGVVRQGIRIIGEEAARAQRP